MDTTVVKNANLALSFLLELCLLAAFGYWGVRTGQGLAAKILFGAGVPLLVAVFWGLFMAPRAAYRVQKTLYLVFKIGLFALAAIALFVAGRSTLAWALVALVAVNIALDNL